MPRRSGPSSRPGTYPSAWFQGRQAETARCPTLVADLLRLLPADEAGRLEGLYQNDVLAVSNARLALADRDVDAWKPGYWR